MPNCTECGVYYDDFDSNCPDCGRNTFQNIVSKSEPTLSEMEPTVQSKPEEDNTEVANFTTDFLEEPIQNENMKKAEEEHGNEINYQPTTVTIEDNAVGNNQIESIDSTLENSFFPQATTIINQSRFQEDNHLGKGIIKPQKIEVDHEGVHFKYDIPAHSFMKAEPAKGKPVEFRITGAEMETKSFNDIIQVNESIKTEPLETNIEAVEEVNSESIEPNMELVEDTKNEPVHEEESPVSLEDEAKPEKTSDELLSEEPLPEPEIKEDSLPETIWEARETWFKIPLFNQYQLTNCSLVITDVYNQHFLEIPLSLITKAAVQRSWFAKLFNIGDLKISVRDFSTSEVVLGGISDPVKIKELLENLCQRKL